ncbi:YwqH-like family protein [Heyndrickxia sporothermodurans]
MSALSLLSERLRRKQEQLDRLQRCQRELTDCQREFFANERFCLSPELSAKTWHGRLAKEFDSIRQYGILIHFKDIENQQMIKTLSTLSQKIQEVNIEISSLEEAIRSETARMMEKEKKD